MELGRFEPAALLVPFAALELQHSTSTTVSSKTRPRRDLYYHHQLCRTVPARAVREDRPDDEMRRLPSRNDSTTLTRYPQPPQKQRTLNSVKQYSNVVTMSLGPYLKLYMTT